MVIHLALVDHNSQLSGIFTPLMREYPEIRISKTYTDPKEAESASSHVDFDILAVNANLPEDGAWKLARTISAPKSDNNSNSTPYVLIVGSQESHEEVMRYIEAGARGYIRQTDPLEDLLATMQYMYRGQAKVTPELAQALMARLWKLASRLNQNSRINAAVSGLTPREYEILHLLKQDLSNQEIGELLSIEVGTVKNHVHNILEKLGATSRKQAAEYIVEERGPLGQRHPKGWSSNT
jgi:DNA-binding NarL/FixJ family response regulator